MAQGLVATIVLCALAFMVCGSFSAAGNVWERVCIGLMITMLASMFGALALAAATYVGLRSEVRRHLRRPLLSDQEFAALLPGDKVDPEQVGEIRALAARCFRRVGGERFYPGDRLEEDLHLRDLAPFGAEAFRSTLEKLLGLDEDELMDRFTERELTTFGDLVMAAAELVEHYKDRSQAAGPLWDRSLDA
jgi:hypothetical protein